MHLRRLKLTNFRSCASTDVRFDETLTVLAGENNGGKTNVIDALRLVTAPSDERRTRFIRPDDLRVGATDLQLEIEFEGLDSAQCGIFFSALSSNAATDASWQFAWAPPTGTARRRAPTWTVGPRTQPEIEPDIRDFIRHVHLPALRDADRDLASSSPGRIEFLLRQLLFGKDDQRDALLRSVRAASDGVLDQPPLTQAQTRVRSAFSPLAAGFHPHDAHLRFVDPTLVGLARDLRFTLTQQGVDPAKLAQTGLGYANLLYLATVLVELEAAKDAELTLLLVEEPEAHLHPQLQRAVLELLQRRAEDSARTSTPGSHAGQIQVVVTTHSPNLTAATSVRRIVVLRTCSRGAGTTTVPVGPHASFEAAQQVEVSCAPQPPRAQATTEHGQAQSEGQPGIDPTSSPAPDPLPLASATPSETVAIAIADLGLDAVAERKIDRYLDVTKASLLFGQRVLLVEGIAEALLMKAFAACVLDAQEQERFRSAAVIAIDGVDFEPYVRLLLAAVGASTARLADTVVVLTDEDPDEPSGVIPDPSVEPVSSTVSIGPKPAASDSVLPAVVPTAKRAAGHIRASELRDLATNLEAAERLHIEVTPRTLEASLISDPTTGEAAIEVLKEAFVACGSPRGREARMRDWNTRIADLRLAERGPALVKWMISTKTRKGDLAQILAALIERDLDASKVFAVPSHIASALRALVAGS